MPPGYENARAKIYCQDCQTTSETAFHFVGLQCACGSYNTREIQRLNVGVAGEVGSSQAAPPSSSSS
jgi:tyrosyl-DNA phosphodiesterase 2